MIKIYKGAAPLDLVRSGEKHAKELCSAYEADPEVYRSGRLKMDVCERIYKSVKAELEACHHGKCCYCEMVFDHHKPYADSHVEHWRPQSCSRQAPGVERMQPGYYWLAYDWDNLFLSCSSCNRNKNDLFPLAYPDTRARHHGMRIEDEMPAILKPDGHADPRDHIKFHEQEPKGLTQLGCKTIEVLGLDRSNREARLTYLNMIRKARKQSIDLMDSVDLVARQLAEFERKIVEEAVRPEKPYSAMVTAFLEANPLPDPSKTVKCTSGTASAG